LWGKNQPNIAANSITVIELAIALEKKKSIAAPIAVIINIPPKKTAEILIYFLIRISHI